MSINLIQLQAWWNQNSAGLVTTACIITVLIACVWSLASGKSNSRSR